jgi:hypothetical protein
VPQRPSSPRPVATPTQEVITITEWSTAIDSDNCPALLQLVRDNTEQTMALVAMTEQRLLVAVRSCLDRGSTATPTPAPLQPVVVKGSGSRNTKPFTLAGDYTVVITGKGDINNVSIVLHDAQSQAYVDLLVNEISRGGMYRYETVQYGLDGTYYLDAEMPDGAWTVTFTPLT